MRATFFFFSLCIKISANLVLQDTIERLYAGNLYAEIPRGVFLVRGENVLLLGEIVWLLPKIWGSPLFYVFLSDFFLLTALCACF